MKHQFLFSIYARFYYYFFIFRNFIYIFFFYLIFFIFYFFLALLETHAGDSPVSFATDIKTIPPLTHPDVLSRWQLLASLDTIYANCPPPFPKPGFISLHIPPFPDVLPWVVHKH